jgi:Cu(I)/Ag(I) efflux system membrane fusion protein/cobalt-zinc-cadmium efflux system membrane fusion protein
MDGGGQDRGAHGRRDREVKENPAMKKIKAAKIGLIVLFLGVVLLASLSCDKKESPASLQGQSSPKALYTCPMHPTYVSDKPGDCPICGMKLVPLEKEEKPAEKPAPQKKIRYKSTMNPAEISDKPGKDSMGMDMVPFEVEEAGETPAVGGRIAVKLSPERRQMIGVRAETVKIQPIHKLIRAVGRVDYAEPNVAFVNLKFEGWVESLFVDSTGRFVKKGEPLLDIYSPELVSAQQEYLLAVKAKNSLGDSGLSVLKSSRERLKLWDISDAQVENLERAGEIKRTLTLYSPFSGFVIEKNVLRGQKITAGENLYKIADISRVWVYGDIYEYELPFIKTQQEARITLSYYPGEAFTGKITFIYPYLNAETRTNRIRVEVPNPSFKLKPEMFANLEIHVDYGAKLAIPVDSVINAGEKKIAFVDLGDGYLEPREIRLGVKGEGIYEVLAGVREGERVVTSANFLVDSESSLKAALRQMTRSPAEEPKHD